MKKTIPMLSMLVLAAAILTGCNKDASMSNPSPNAGTMTNTGTTNAVSTVTNMP